MDRISDALVCGITVDSNVIDHDFYHPMRTLLSYWNERREKRPAIPRANFDPVDIPRLLPNIFLVDLISRDPVDLEFRLVGTRITELEGSVTGWNLKKLIPRKPDTESLWAHYERVMAGQLCLRFETLAWQNRNFVRYAVLLLPMTRAGKDIDSAVGMALYGRHKEELP